MILGLPKPGVLLLLGVVLAGTNVNAADAGWAEFDGLIAKSQKAMNADPAAALANARAADAFATRHRGASRYRESLATALWLEAESSTRLNKIAQARAALDAASRIAAADGKITKLDGDLALTRARLAGASSNYAIALRSYQQAHAVFVRLGIPRSQAIALLGLGGIYEKAREYDREVGYYRDAARAYSGEPVFDLSVANNTGFALQQIGRYDDAIERYRQALKIAVSLRSSMLEASILTNIAMSEARLHNLQDADKTANRALKLLGPKDESGEAPFVWVVKADVEYQRGALRNALADLDKSFQGHDLKTTTAPFRDAHEIAYKVYRDAGDYPRAIAHLEAFKRLDDEGRSVAASANLALTSAQFDFANQQLEIAKLKAAQLERDISLRESRAAMQAVVFAAVLLAGLVLIAWIAWRHFLVRRHRNAIRQKNRELVRTLAERDREIARRVEFESQLRIAMEAAQQANRAKSHFLANMSHELRTPLNAIIGFSELLMSGAVEPSRAREYASSIADGGRRLFSILSDILDMARMEAGKVTLDETTISLGDVVKRALSAPDWKSRVEAMQLRFDGTNGDICVRVDDLRLEQILTNLVSNAVKFSGADGKAEIRIEPAMDGVDLVVRDNGAGIPADKLGIIMEPFGQAEDAYARAHGGSGLGLPIVKALVELHGGRLVIASTVGRGTEARVHLPAERVLGRGEQRTRAA